MEERILLQFFSISVQVGERRNSFFENKLTPEAHLKMGASEIKYFESRSEPTFQKILILMTDVIIDDLVIKIELSVVFGLSVDEVTNISNNCRLVSFV